MEENAKTKITAEIAEDLKAEREIDQDFAREREKLDEEINALREELKPIKRE